MAYGVVDLSRDQQHRLPVLHMVPDHAVGGLLQPHRLVRQSGVLGVVLVILRPLRQTLVLCVPLLREFTGQLCHAHLKSNPSDLYAVPTVLSFVHYLSETFVNVDHWP